MMKAAGQPWLTTALGIGLTLAASAAALAQSAPPPQANRPISAILGYTIAFVLFAAVVTVSLMPSKRSHQD